jgi:hypothetical protein
MAFVTASAYSERQLIFLCKIDGLDYIANTRSTNNHRRMFVNHGIPYRSRLIIAGFPLLDKLTA